jgi:hypothetical protein
LALGYGRFRVSVTRDKDRGDWLKWLIIKYVVVKLSHNDRTQPMQTAALVRIAGAPDERLSLSGS